MPGRAGAWASSTSARTSSTRRCGNSKRWKAARADPRETRIKIGLISFEKGDFERAATEFNLVLAGDPDNDRARYYLGATYVEMKADDKALEAFERVSEKSELYVDRAVQAAYLYDRKEQTQKAIEAVASGAREAKRPQGDLCLSELALPQDQGISESDPGHGAGGHLRSQER